MNKKKKIRLLKNRLNFLETELKQLKKDIKVINNEN